MRESVRPSVWTAYEEAGGSCPLPPPAGFVALSLTARAPHKGGHSEATLNSEGSQMELLHWIDLGIAILYFVKFVAHIGG